MDFTYIIIGAICGVVCIIGIFVYSLLQHSERENNRLRQMLSQSTSAGFFAGVVSLNCEAEGYDGKYDIHTGYTKGGRARAENGRERCDVSWPDKGLFFFIVYGEGSDNVIFRIKDGNRTKVLDTNMYVFNDVRVYSLCNDPTLAFDRVETRPDDIYLSVMPENHPECETFYTPAVPQES